MITKLTPDRNKDGNFSGPNYRKIILDLVIICVIMGGRYSLIGQPLASSVGRGVVVDGQLLTCKRSRGLCYVFRVLAKQKQKSVDNNAYADG